MREEAVHSPASGGEEALIEGRSGAQPSRWAAGKVQRHTWHPIPHTLHTCPAVPEMASIRLCQGANSVPAVLQYDPVLPQAVQYESVEQLRDGTVDARY